MSKFDDLELIISHTERQLEAYREEFAKLKEEEKAKFIPGEVVQYRDYDSGSYKLGVFIGMQGRTFITRSIGSDSGDRGASWNQCRLPKDVPGILIRHDGSDVCPVSDKAKWAVIMDDTDKSVRITRVTDFRWKRASYYVILPDHVK